MSRQSRPGRLGGAAVAAAGATRDLGRRSSHHQQSHGAARRHQRAAGAQAPRARADLHRFAVRAPRHHRVAAAAGRRAAGAPPVASRSRTRICGSSSMQLAAGHDLEWHWVQGHSGVPGQRALRSAGEQRDRCVACGRIAPMRQIVLDTETTGLEAATGSSHHRNRLRRAASIAAPPAATFTATSIPSARSTRARVAVHGMSRSGPGRQAALRRDRRGIARSSSPAPS